ncbi:hypothetical protein QQ73_19415 [Candidatus Endoriftia persephone str. Guaymas]|nr:hypothetical protein [Candidatus Endoriftia persephone str. Guaymas]
MNIKQAVPWWLKIVIKILLSRLPVAYRLWHRLGIFQHGRMAPQEYALKVFERHLTQAGMADRVAGARVLELGPGDSIATALIVAAYGGEAVLVDVGAFADADPQIYRALAEYLEAQGLNPPDLSQAGSLDAILSVCGARYLTEGLKSLHEIEADSIDLIFSQAVLEHVRLAEFDPTLAEFRRILRPGGLCSHQVDLKDHLAASLNNLRFSKRLWESDFFASSGFYTNRIRYGEMLKRFEAAGFAVEVCGEERWDALPLARTKLNQAFQQIPDQQLLISSFDVLLRSRG